MTELEDAPAITAEQQERLLNAAEEARKNAYNPNAGLLVGAALLTDDGDIYRGSNVGATSQAFCAERSAVMNAVTHGARQFTAIAVTADIDEPITPCGVCRQLLIEFADVAGHDMHVIMHHTDGDVQTSRLSELLPGAFSPTVFDWE